MDRGLRLTGRGEGGKREGGRGRGRWSGGGGGPLRVFISLLFIHGVHYTPGLAPDLIRGCVIS